MRFNNLNDWLTWQETLNPAEIELGLERVTEVLKQAGLSNKFNCPLITVAGTNGKGSIVAMLEAIAIASGLNVCSYTSPHLFHYNERIKVNAKPIDDKRLCEAFERLDQARGEHPLTYFEFGTLAAIDLFFKQQPDLVILEVGLGGRLDAVNIMDSDVSVISTIAIDHIDWLGDDRESIGFEKAGVFRKGKTVVCGELDLPNSVIEHAKKLNCNLLQLNKDYHFSIDKAEESWALDVCGNKLSNLAQPSLLGDFQYNNASTAIVALQSLPIPVFQQDDFTSAISTGLKNIQLSGRFQLINTHPQVYVDVAHNPQAARSLASQLKQTRKQNTKTWAVIAMLADKDIQGVIAEVENEIDCWCIAGLENITRGLSAQALIEKLPPKFVADNAIEATNEKNQCKMHETILIEKTVKEACENVLLAMNEKDRLVVFGSFYTVSEAMNFFSES